MIARARSDCRIATVSGYGCLIIVYDCCLDVGSALHGAYLPATFEGVSEPALAPLVTVPLASLKLSLSNDVSDCDLHRTSG